MANTIRTCQAAVSGTSIALRTNAESAKSARSMCRQRRQPAGLARRLPWNMSSRDRRCRRRRPEGPRQQLPPAVLRQRQRNRRQGRRQHRLHDRHQPRSKRKRHLYIFRSGNRTGVRAKRQHQPMVMRTMQKLQGSRPPFQMTLVYVIALVAHGGAIGRTGANAGRASSTREKVGNHVLRDS